MKIRARKSTDKVELLMTPMIDIVFQLLIFFIMTFRINVQEGDFTIKMPLASTAAAATDTLDLPPMKLRLRANLNGDLASVTLNDRQFGQGGKPWSELNNHIISLIGNESGPVRESAEVELDCDYNLNFEHVIAAITAVSGYVGNQREVVKLVEKIKFAPQRSEGGKE